jgi:predicted TIM-barrel fold metal-dependent hydrolase
VAAAETERGIVDVDIHTHIDGTLEALLPYVDKRWRTRLDERRDVPLPGSALTFREKFAPYSGAPPSDPASARALLDQAGIETGVLISIQAGAVDGMTDREEASVLARAFNDYYIDRWVSDEKRLKLVAVVGPRNPELAAAEVRRVAEIPGVVAVWVPLIDRLLGSPHYAPILQAANDVELPIVLHPTGNYGISQGSPHYAAGHPADDAERFVNLPAIAAANIVDMMWEGAFTKYSRLRFMFVEFGWQWVGGLCWKMDAAWKAGRRNAPWLRRPPTEYILDHVRVTWDPFGGYSADGDDLSALEISHAERTLCFGSGVPGDDSAAPAKVALGSNHELQQRVLRDNAVEMFGARFH